MQMYLFFPKLRCTSPILLKKECIRLFSAFGAESEINYRNAQKFSFYPLIIAAPYQGAPINISFFLRMPWLFFITSSFWETVSSCFLFLFILFLKRSVFWSYYIIEAMMQKKKISAHYGNFFQCHSDQLWVLWVFLSDSAPEVQYFCFVQQDLE